MRMNALVGSTEIIDREEILRKIRNCWPQLHQLGVKQLAIFGSIARGERQASSDLDVLVEFDGAPSYDAYMETRFLLEDSLNMHIDLVTEQSILPRLRPYIERDLIYVTE